MLSEAKADVSRVRALPAPSGAPSGSSWIVIPAEDGGACLSVDGGLSCGPKESVLAAGMSGLRISPGGTAESERNAKSMEDLGGTATITGLAPQSATSVVAETPAGKRVGAAQAPRRLYQLTIPTAELGTLKFLGADGTLVATHSMKQRVGRPRCPASCRRASRLPRLFHLRALEGVGFICCPLHGEAAM